MDIMETVEGLEEHLRDLGVNNIDDDPYAGLYDISDEYLSYDDLNDIADGMFGLES